MPRLLDIVQRPAEAAQRCKHVLYNPAERVSHFDEALAASIRDLIATMHHEQGIGIAAPQVGWPLQIFIIQAEIESPRYPLLRRYPDLKNVAQQIFINPRITAASTETIGYWHGCLSGKGHERGLLRTYRSISFAAQDCQGLSFEGTLDSLGAIIFQHEFRHLLGTIYYDHAKDFLSLDQLLEKTKEGTVQLYTAQPDLKIPHMLADYRVGESIEDYKKRQEPPR